MASSISVFWPFFDNQFSLSYLSFFHLNCSIYTSNKIPFILFIITHKFSNAKVGYTTNKSGQGDAQCCGNVSGSARLRQDGPHSLVLRATKTILCYNCRTQGQDISQAGQVGDSEMVQYSLGQHKTSKGASAFLAPEGPREPQYKWLWNPSISKLDIYIQRASPVRTMQCRKDVVVQGNWQMFAHHSFARAAIVFCCEQFRWITNKRSYLEH